jgi:predicted DNA-binding antitoxin AbrB/MazE fold protein
MERTLQAVYQDGVLQPLQSVELEEKQRVTVTITDPSSVSQDTLAGYFTPEEWAEAVHDDVSLDEVRRALSTISGSLSEAVIALRQER